MNIEGDAQFFSFESQFVPCPPGTPAIPRPPGRPREPVPGGEIPEAVLVSFECEAEILPPGTPAAPRPPDRPRNGSAEALARELADHVLAYVRNHPAGATAEQVAAMVQQLLARRSA